MEYLILLILIIVTIIYLPFINLDAALSFQFWIRRAERKLEELIEKIERESNKKGK